MQEHGIELSDRKWISVVLTKCNLYHVSDSEPIEVHGDMGIEYYSMDNSHMHLFRASSSSTSMTPEFVALSMDGGTRSEHNAFTYLEHEEFVHHLISRHEKIARSHHIDRFVQLDSGWTLHDEGALAYGDNMFRWEDPIVAFTWRNNQSCSATYHPILKEEFPKMFILYKKYSNPIVRSIDLASICREYEACKLISFTLEEILSDEMTITKMAADNATEFLESWNCKQRLPCGRERIRRRWSFEAFISTALLIVKK